MDLDTLRTRLTAFGLPRVDEVLARAIPATELALAGTTSETSTDSRIGGLPFLPPGVPWPRKDRPLAFIAQVRLDPLPGAATVLGLPPTGMLSFFYDMVDQPWGFDPADRGSFAVIHTEDPESCEAAPYPDDYPPDCRIAPLALAPMPTTTLPSFADRLFPSELFEDDEIDAWAEALVDLSEELGWGERTLLGGHPHVIQNDMRLECEIVARNGVYAGGPDAYGAPRMPEWEKESGEWVHLLQVASEEDAGLMWGDVGCLYYWMRKDDLAARRFDRAWLVLQCY